MMFRLLEDSVGIPEYYMALSIWLLLLLFQRQDEWLGLKENHPHLFEKAKEYEKRQRERYDLDIADKRFIGSGNYTWSKAGTLDEVVKAEKRRAEKELSPLQMILTTAARYSQGTG